MASIKIHAGRDWRRPLTRTRREFFGLLLDMLVGAALLITVAMLPAITSIARLLIHRINGPGDQDEIRRAPMAVS